MRDQVIAWLNENVSPHRLQHILGVEQTCIELACCHGVDTQKAATAGLMHDLAKFFPKKRLLKIAQKNNIKIDKILASHPHLLHADVSAVIAQTEFNIQDDDILAAIANHTLGHPKMSDLSCIVFVADALEPNRGDTPELNKIRQISHHYLHHAVQLTCDYVIKYLLDHEKIIHPRAIKTRNWALAVTSDE
ncbi:MAG: bis(5'-nucleosyl)-tetraphosphatase (symmetrical) YqeK [Microcystaceae cyanobacterium]